MTQIRQICTDFICDNLPNLGHQRSHLSRFCAWYKLFSKTDRLGHFLRLQRQFRG